MLPPISLQCPYCQSSASRTDSSRIYGRSYGLIYLCDRYPNCDAYVGCHRDGTAKGILANRRLRAFRKLTHQNFDPLWQEGIFESWSAAYQWLSEQMELPAEATHIAMFDEKQCLQCIELIKKKSAYLNATGKASN